MSQVIKKFAKGDKFTWDGVAEFELDDLIKELATGIDAYLNTILGRGAEDLRPLVRAQIGEYIKGIRNGTLSRNADGTFTNTADSFSNDGKLHDKKFMGINVGGISSKDPAKDNRGKHNITGLAANYIAKTLNKMHTSATSVPETPVIGNYNGDLMLEKILSKKYFSKPVENAGEFDWAAYRGQFADNNAAILGIYDALRDINSDLLYNEYTWTGTSFPTVNDFKSAWNSLVASLADGWQSDKDAASFNKLGISYVPFVEWEHSAQRKIAQQLAQLEAEAAAVKAKEDADWLNYPDGKDDTTFDSNTYKGVTRKVFQDGSYKYYYNGNELTEQGAFGGNPFNGLGNMYYYDNNIYLDNNLPALYASQAATIRQGMLPKYTKIENGKTPWGNGIHRYASTNGYKYMSNLSSYLSGLDGAMVYGLYADPTKWDSAYKFRYRSKDGNTIKYGTISFNDMDKNYYFNPDDGSNVINLGAYNSNGAYKNVPYQNWTDFSTVKKGLEVINNWLADKNARNNNQKNGDADSIVSTVLQRWVGGNYNGTMWKKHPNKPNRYILKEEYSRGNVIQAVKCSDGKWRLFVNREVDDRGNITKKTTSTKTQTTLTLALKDYIDKAASAYKQGGRLNKIFKAQIGLRFEEVKANNSIPQGANTKTSNKSKDIHNSYSRSGVTLDQTFSGKARDSFENQGGVISNWELVRMGAALTDLVGVGVGLIPGANLASTVTGVGASTAEFTADIGQDGLDWGDVGNYALNLGMDAISLVPGLKTVKGGKAIMKIAKWVPRLATIIGAANFTDPQLRKSCLTTIQKLGKGEVGSLTTGDIKNISTMLNMVNTLRTSKTSLNKLNSHIVKNSKKGTVEVSISKDGKAKNVTVELTETELKQSKDKQHSTVVERARKKYNEGLDEANQIKADDSDVIYDYDTKFSLRRGKGAPKAVMSDGEREAGSRITKYIPGANYLIGYRDPLGYQHSRGPLARLVGLESPVLGTSSGRHLPLSDRWFAHKALHNNPETKFVPNGVIEALRTAESAYVSKPKPEPKPKTEPKTVPPTETPIVTAEPVTPSPVTPPVVESVVLDPHNTIIEFSNIGDVVDKPGKVESPTVLTPSRTSRLERIRLLLGNFTPSMASMPKKTDALQLVRTKTKDFLKGLRKSKPSKKAKPKDQSVTDNIIVGRPVTPKQETKKKTTDKSRNKNRGGKKHLFGGQLEFLESFKQGGHIRRFDGGGTLTDQQKAEKKAFAQFYSTNLGSNYGINDEDFQAWLNDDTKSVEDLVNNWKFGAAGTDASKAGTLNRDDGDLFRGKQMLRPVNVGDIYKVSRAYSQSNKIGADVLAAYNESTGRGNNLDLFIAEYNNNVDTMRNSYKGYGAKDYRANISNSYNTQHHNYYSNYGLDYDPDVAHILGSNTIRRTPLSFTNDDENKANRLVTLGEGENAKLVWINNEGKLQLYTASTEPKPTEPTSTEPAPDEKPAPVVKKDKLQPDEENNDGVITAVDPESGGNDSNKFKRAFNPSGIMQLGQLATSIIGTHLAAKPLRDNIWAPVVPKRHQSAILHRGFVEEGQGKLALARYRHLGQQNLDSDTQVNFAKMLEAEDKGTTADQNKQKESSDIFWKSYKEVNDLEDWNRDQQIDAMNTNNDRYAAYTQAQNQITSDAIKNDFLNVASGIASFAAKADQHATMANKYGLQARVEDWKLNHYRTLQEAQDAYETAYTKFDPTGTKGKNTFNATPEGKRLLRQYDDIKIRSNQYINNQLARYYGKFSIFAANGSKLSAEDRIRIQKIKDFNKALREHSKQTNTNINKAQDRLHKENMQSARHIADLFTKAAGFK